MGNVAIREVEITDIPAIKSVASKVWDWDSFTSNDMILDATLGLYLNQVLHVATFGRVVTVDDKVVGAIFGSMDGQPCKYRTMLEESTAHALTLLGAPNNVRKNIYGYLNTTNAIYRELIRGIKNKYDGVLDFLILAEESRGLGAGKALWLALREYFREHRAKAIYLYTDTHCNFGFYDHFGFNRKREQDVKYKFHFAFIKFPYKMTLYLYEYVFSD